MEGEFPVNLIYFENNPTFSIFLDPVHQAPAVISRLIPRCKLCSAIALTMCIVLFQVYSQENILNASKKSDVILVTSRAQ